MELQSDLHGLFVSSEVLNELDNQRYPQREEALAFISGVPLVEVDEASIGLATILVRERVMPQSITGDPIHVAAACVHGMDYLLTWNVRHLANPNKLAYLQTICVRAGYMPPRIITPDLLWEK